MFDEGGVKWKSILGGVGLSGKSVVLERWAMWQAGQREPSTSLPHSATGDVGDARPPTREPVFSMYL